MKAKRRESSTRAQQARRSGKPTSGELPPIPDSEIDFSDIPELTDEQLRGMRRVGRPPVGDATKVPIAFRINPNLLSRIRAMAAERGESYQGFMHELLEKGAARLTKPR